MAKRRRRYTQGRSGPISWSPRPSSIRVRPRSGPERLAKITVWPSDVRSAMALRKACGKPSNQRPIVSGQRICKFPTHRGRGRRGRAVATAHSELWRKRLNVPAYRIMEAARYARTSNQTIRNWEKIRGNSSVVTGRDDREALSYLQLIEVGVVAAMRQSGVKLDTIRDARKYLSTEFKSPFPFAQYRFKTDGKTLFWTTIRS
jgi:hypothetical protein